MFKGILAILLGSRYDYYSPYFTRALRIIRILIIVSKTSTAFNKNQSFIQKTCDTVSLSCFMRRNLTILGILKECAYTKQ